MEGQLKKFMPPLKLMNIKIIFSVALAKFQVLTRTNKNVWLDVYHVAQYTYRTFPSSQKVLLDRCGLDHGDCNGGGER